MSARELTMAEWAEGQNIALEFRVLGIEGKLASVQPVITAGDTELWAGKVSTLMPDHRLALTGLTIQGDDLVFKDLGVIL